ncbi:MAG: acyltransferase [Clostridiales bacterium]|nr:acyltransferase [Clostridiales bacterium]
MRLQSRETILQQENRIQFLDYLKAICVLMVIVTHYDWKDKTSPFFTMLINMAVPIFMMISGYNFAMSNRRNTGGNLGRMYGWQTIKPKLIRFLSPFFVICLIEMILLYLGDRSIRPLRIFLLGAYGPGSYYVPIMLQFLVIFPILYMLVEKNAKLGLFAAGMLNLLFEIAVKYMEMEKYYYRLSIGRYLLLIAFGCYLYLYPKHRVKRYQMIFMFLLGMAYLVAVFGFEKDLPLFPYWKTTAMPVAFYIFPIVILLFRKFYHSTIKGGAGRLLAWIGKASYHIFLVQMVYYHFDLGGALMDAVWYFAVPFHVLILIPLGLAFYEADDCLMRSMKNRKRGVATKCLS